MAKKTFNKNEKELHTGKQSKMRANNGGDNGRWTLSGDLWGRLTPWISICAFAILAWIMLVVKNSDYLYLVQERSLFSDTEVFFNERMAVPSGLIQWIGCYLTQLFYYPMLGSSVLIGIWVITFFAMKHAFKLSDRWSAVLIIPLAALLCSVVDLGYWVYYLKSPGYWFAQSLCFLFTVIGIWIGRLCGKSIWGKMAWMTVWTVGGYPLLGVYALFGTAVMAIMTLNQRREGLLYVAKIVLAAALIGVVPLLWYNIYTTFRIEDAWITGLPLFYADKNLSLIPSIPFVVAAVALTGISLASALISKKQDSELSKLSKTQLVLASFATLLLCSLGVNYFNFDDYNYHAEIRMYRAVDEQRWNDVLAEMADIPDDPTREMVMFKNIALMNTGETGDKMFKYANTGKPPHVYDSLAVHMVQTAGSMIYYQYGKANFAYRWCVENGVEFGYNIDNLKLMTKCAIVSGEPVLAMKYINILKTTTFHKEWAKRFEKLIIENTDIATAPEFGIISHLRLFKNITDGDQGLCEMYILNYFANTMNKDDKILQETTLAYSLIQKDIQLFWPRFFLYATLHGNEQMPIHYQEAAYLYGHLEKQVDISKMPFDKDRIVNRYNQFGQVSQAFLRQGMSNEQVGKAMKASFGDTFWWFYYFCNDIKSY